MNRSSETAAPGWHRAKPVVGLPSLFFREGVPMSIGAEGSGRSNQ
ncbi:hypothetical protein NC99_15140 [Sunxiuqinia dokdonensis]|uniref:Uncharacterized protein n=1 Tax=Sunxiuqinia dokdonensis TaxID=1409788 RepID=A0A0L8VB18_9BACT|nr:hypothetical protein NC99_15140 [Sunxiuqinia dokdonensis]